MSKKLVEIEVELDAATLKYYKRLAKFAEVRLNTVLRIALAAGALHSKRKKNHKQPFDDV